MNPYQQLMGGQDSVTPQAPQVAQKGPAISNYLPDVAQNIGQDKLAKHPYNPYGLIMLPAQNDPNAAANTPAGKFTQELLKDSRE